VAISAEDIEFINELFEAVGHITTRKMMGGLTVYADGQVFAILDSDGQLFLKASGDMAKRLEAAGGKLFTYEGKNGKTGHMNYWTMPEDALDEPAVAAEWAREVLLAL